MGRERSIPKAYGPEALLIGGGYVYSLPTTMKSEWAVKAAANGKHILVEKPFASESDVRLMVEACAKHNVQFMDGTMWVHHIRAEKARSKVRKCEDLTNRRCWMSLKVALLVK